MATPLKMDFIKAILPGDRCREKKGKSQKRMRPLPLVDPLRMIITFRRLNFAPATSLLSLLPPSPSEGSTPQRTASFTLFVTSPCPRCLPFPSPLSSPVLSHSSTILNDLFPIRQRSPLTDWSTNQCGIQAAVLKL